MAKRITAAITEAVETIELSSQPRRPELSAADHSCLTEIRQRRLKLAARSRPEVRKTAAKPVLRGWLALLSLFVLLVLWLV